MSDQKFCCDEFAEMATEEVVPGLGEPGTMDHAATTLHYPAQFKKLDDGTWVVNGCCGGGCYVVVGMRFCPFCGSRLTAESVLPANCER